MKIHKQYNGLEIAIIGMSGRFCNSRDHREFWQNLADGKEMIKVFTDEELMSTGVSQSAMQDPNYVRSMGVVSGKDCFDAAFFGYSAEEAAFMDPQIRVFHEQCWSALEDAGYAAQIEKYRIGLFAGATGNDYWKLATYSRSANCSIDPFYLNMISSQNFISTLISYKLNLRGPSFYIDSACSTSLSAVHLACRSLLTKDCSIVLAGGVSLRTLRSKGYFHQEGMIVSGDGHCRTFDSQASGTAMGEGAGVVVLKRLSEAIKDRDHIYCIIKSTAANNDGNQKVGYTAPSVAGQTECIKIAQKLAGLDPANISYIEAHGTATKLGDPIEIRALNEAFAKGGKDKFCAIASVKSNIGHLDAAAGVAGLMKTALSLEHRQIPASLHFKAPNPEIDFDGGPFYVNTSLKEWVSREQLPRYAGVNSLGIGGTNVHVVLEEAPEPNESDQGRLFQLLTLSARTNRALARNTSTLRNFLIDNPDTSMPDMSYTYQTGRKHFEYRKAIVYKDRQELLQLLDQSGVEEIQLQHRKKAGPVVFMFSGAGSQYANMGRRLYEQESLFSTEMDKGFSMLKDLTGYDYRSIFYPADKYDQRMNDMLHTQPAIFLFGYALARYLMSLGVKPDYLIGHSIGEYAAACIGGVFGLEDALKLVVRRGQLMNGMPPGAMLTAFISEQEAHRFTCPTVSLAAVNGPEQVVFSGTTADIDSLTDTLEELNITYVRLKVNHAGHSHMSREIVTDYMKDLSQTKMHEPQIPLLSNLTGRPAAAAEIATPIYWARHLCETIRFSDGIHYLARLNENTLFVEIGASHSLTTLVRQHRKEKIDLQSVNLIRHPKEQEDDVRYFMGRLGQLWAYGVNIDWKAYYGHEKRNRISLPAYSFEQVQYPAEFNLSDVMVLPANIATIGNEPHADERGVPTDVVESFPTRQKLDRPALFADFVQASTATEEKLREIFEKFFGIEPIGVEDDFFELGGDSLKGMMLLRRIKKEFDVSLNIKDLFINMNIKLLAEAIDGLLWLKNDVELNNEIRI